MDKVAKTISRLKKAGFTNREIIDAVKAGQLAELFALVGEKEEE